MIMQCTGDDPYRCKGCSHVYKHKKNDDCDTVHKYCPGHECKEFLD